MALSLCAEIETAVAFSLGGRGEDEGLGGLSCQAQLCSWQKDTVPSHAVALLLPGLLFCLKALTRWEANVCSGSEAPGKFLGVPGQAELESGGLVSILIHSRGHGAGVCVCPSVCPSLQESPSLHLNIPIPGLGMKLPYAEENDGGENDGEERTDGGQPGDGEEPTTVARSPQ